MSRITRINFAGFAFTVALLTTTFAMSLMAMGCGPAPAPRPVPPAAGSGASTFLAPTTPSGVIPGVGVNDISGFNPAQLGGALGTYRGSFPVYYDDEVVEQPYTLVLSMKHDVSAAPGKTFVQAVFNAGAVSFQTLVMIHAIAPTWGDSGPEYVFTSPRFHAPAFNPYGFVYFQLRATVNQNTNLFDPTSPPIINIVDGEFFRAVVDFNAYGDSEKL